MEIFSIMFTVFDESSMEGILSVLAMSVQHVANTSFVVISIFITGNVLTRSMSLCMYQLELYLYMMHLFCIILEVELVNKSKYLLNKFIQ